MRFDRALRHPERRPYLRHAELLGPEYRYFPLARREQVYGRLDPAFHVGRESRRFRPVPGSVRQQVLQRRGVLLSLAPSKAHPGAQLLPAPVGAHLVGGYAQDPGL